MDDRKHGEHEGGGSPGQQGGDERHSGHGEDCGPEGDRGGGPGGGGPDTRFLQLEMSQVLYSEAEAVTKQAFRDLLLEAAKERWRQRFGDKITELAHLAVDELMKDVRSSLDVEGRIQERNQDPGPSRDRLRGIFAEGGSPQKGRGERNGGSPPRKGKR